MHSEVTISKVRTRFDYELLSEEDKTTFKGYLKGTIDRQSDIQEYPEGYWNNRPPLKEGDEGYFPPILQDIKDFSVIERFGFTEEELNQ
jgi:hypothetical protein